jgi:hypothetical protein
LIIAGSTIGSRWGIEGVCGAVVITSIVCFVFAAHLINRHLEITWRAFSKAYLPAVLLGLPVLGVLVAGKIVLWHDAPVVLQFPIEAAVTGLVVYVACLAKPAWFVGPDGIWLIDEVRGHVPARLRFLIPASRVDRAKPL